MAISKFIALVFAFAAVAATLQLSEARVQGFNQEEADDASKTASGSAGSLPGFPFPLPQIPGLPPLFPLPQIPGLPPLPSFPHLPVPPTAGTPAAPGLPGLPTSSPPPPPPAECLTPLTQMIPCLDYLTNITVFTPPDMCCDGLKSIITNAPICLCHGMNGDMSKLFPTPIDPIRMLILPLRCGTMLPLRTLFSCNSQSVPPLLPPTTPTPPASPVSPGPPSVAPKSPAPAASPVSTPTEVSP
ncbi:uncharacterized protein [Lolium perenne]|uniref:uncharacterized protein n=1 Tax=Lolium perenne TaxID=4522 RepID=UPI0021F61DAF|nr:proline-rich receptor-like protein kinase PERK2 [Lolium perenne]